MSAGAENTRIIRDAGGSFCVEEGSYLTRNEAEERQRFFAVKNIEPLTNGGGPMTAPA